jgi:hypothetical protein
MTRTVLVAAKDPSADPGKLKAELAMTKAAVKQACVLLRRAKLIPFNKDLAEEVAEYLAKHDQYTEGL